MNNKDKIIYELWKLLDNIDTASDMYKNDLNGFSSFTFKEQQKRHELLSDEQVKKLYDEYFVWDSE